MIVERNRLQALQQALSRSRSLQGNAPSAGVRREALFLFVVLCARGTAP